MSGGAEAARPAGERRLSDAEARKLRVWRAIVKGSIGLTWICLLAQLAFLFWPRAPRGLKIATGAVLLESFLTAVLIGAFGKCPACGANFGLDAKRLMPERCRACGVALKPSP
jgi:hypothetical protein